MIMRTYFYYAMVRTPGLDDGVSSGIFSSNAHPADPRFFHELTVGIAAEFPWHPKASEVIVKTLNVLCEKPIPYLDKDRK